MTNHNHRVIHKLQELDKAIQPFIDQMKQFRQSSEGVDKYRLSYVSKKVDLAAKAIGMALEKMENE
jgi:hypothetical protein